MKKSQLALWSAFLALNLIGTGAIASVYSKHFLDKGRYQIDCKKGGSDNDLAIKGWVEIGKVKGETEGEFAAGKADASAKLKVKISDLYANDGYDDKDDFQGKYSFDMDDIDDHDHHEIKLENNAIVLSIIFWKDKTDAYARYKGREPHSESCSVTKN